MKKFAFIYFMKKNRVEKIKQTVSAHIDYWHKRNLDSYQGGPFSDRSGGLIIFNTRDFEHAEELVNQDPFVKNDLLDQRWVNEWDTDE